MVIQVRGGDVCHVRPPANELRVFVDRVCPRVRTNKFGKTHTMLGQTTLAWCRSHCRPYSTRVAAGIASGDGAGVKLYGDLQRRSSIYGQKKRSRSSFEVFFDENVRDLSPFSTINV